MNGLKTMVLMVTLTLMLVAIGGILGGKSGMTFALIMAFGMNFITYWFSDKIVLRMYGAKPVTEVEAPELYSIVRRLAQRAGLPMPKVYIMDEDQPNAFATGRNPNHGVVAVTTGIMRILSREELEGVIAHELAHIKHRDILVSTVAATIAGAISYLAQMAQWAMIFGGRHDDEEGGGNPIAAIVMMIVGPIAAMLVQMAISRSREYGADEGGARISGNPMYLANALKKLHIASQRIPMDANPATSHMFIVNPLSGGGLLKLFSTHPPIEERIARLESMRMGR
ncbi:protease HtpX [Dissulfurispira thermophila]|uniref:Protease HtpX homolog n=1 Tax=Dissulfurispira thermophila TaxID=2715679 RepID=A0A7G1H189_9BACT|nr:zinc metalloprotease HtpX [Dissulfurispira thermophila]BCB95457.1 protease HtpX [Dissulfurispira thermophila]